MKINDELLEKLGIYFVYHDIYNRYGITFESFVDRWVRGFWIYKKTLGWSGKMDKSSDAIKNGAESIGSLLSNFAPL